MQNLAYSTPNASSIPQRHLRWWWWDGKNTLLWVSLTVAVVTWYVVKAWSKKRTRLPPGPAGVPIFGNLPFLDRNLHHHLTQLAKTYGPIMRLRLGRRLCVVVSSPSIAKELLKQQDAIVANHDVPTAALVLPNGLHGLAWAPHGQQWRTLRRLTVGSLLSTPSLEPYRSLRRREILQMVQRVHDSAVAGCPLQVRELVYSTLYNVITGMLWGGVLQEEGMENVAKEFRQVVEDIRGTFGRLGISDFFPILSPLDLQGLERKRKKIADKLHQILGTIMNQRLQIDDRRTKEKEGEDFLQFLLRIKDNGETEMPLTKDHIKGLLMDLVMAGMDTTTTTMEWAMSEMMHNQGVMRKAQEELDQVVGSNSTVEETHLPKLRYLNAVVKETLRLHPATPIMLPRTPSKSCTAGGYTIPQGCRIVVNLWGMQRDPNAWSEPSEFKPERFLDGGKWDFSGNDFHFFPFGTGRRICPGAPLADRMLTYTLASLLHSFSWRLPEGTMLDLSETFGVVLKKTEPLVAVPSRR
ncbi:geraniol 8-hydroxylase-like [Aristolochia californica]|uniref:geraniol 8-hydroxylase-like n=1 Tax=Aristolochia californica TaxID=171875 RepID=UPI0035DF2F0A